MNAIHLTIAGCFALCLVACGGHRGPKVPDMPYVKKPSADPLLPSNPVQTGEPSTLTDTQILPPIDGGAARSASNPVQAPSYVPSASSTMNPVSSSISVPSSAPNTEPTLTQPAPVLSSGYTDNVTPSMNPGTGYAPLPPSVSPASVQSALPPDNSTPVAKKVPGDLHRVYNPWNPKQRIIITNPQTGLPFPSGKKLGVPGTSKTFIVP